jgi:hypothetical protein
VTKNVWAGITSGWKNMDKGHVKVDAGGAEIADQETGSPFRR